MWTRLKNPQLQQRLRIRSRIIQLIREFFVREGFLEVETPTLVPAAGQEPHLNPLRTRVWDERGRSREAYLITSPEYAHKKMLAGGFEKTFEITKSFRAGEQWGGLHNPEFTILEWYRAHADYTKIMDDVERMVQFVARAILDIRYSKLGNSRANKPKYPISNIEYQDKIIDLSLPWQRLTVAGAFEKYADTTLDEVPDEETFFKIFLTHIEQKLGISKPTILYEYPASMAALAKFKDSSPPPQSTPHPNPLPQGEREIVVEEEAKGDSPPLVGGVRGGGRNAGKVAERFELYIAGMELANAFSELTDAVEQRNRFLDEQNLRKKLGKEMIPLDEDFLDAVGHMPPSAGIAFGVDRLVMLLTDAKSIEDVLTFPASQLF